MTDSQTKTVLVVDSCGGVYGDTHGSAHLYEIDEDLWEQTELYSKPPGETLSILREHEETSKVTEIKTMTPDDVVTV